MASSDAFERPSSPAGHATSSQQRGGEGRSRFTYRQLAQLGQSSTSSPLRTVAHIDLDAFYAQCESIRLGLPEEQPLAVQQWAGLIAVNYPARDRGVTRFLDIGEARRLCPDIVLQHVATWREGDDRWHYHPDAFGRVATHKVSLDPYRAQSRRILACIRAALPPVPAPASEQSQQQQRVEKASVDEVFIDLSALVHGVLLRRYPELARPPAYDDPSERLPRPPTTALDWASDALVDLDDGHTEDDDPDWDDVAMCAASEIVRGVRRAVRDELGFTCSAGVAKNKMLAKLGSAHKKPNGQTVVRNRAVQHFLSGFKFTKIRNLGGKLGERVVAAFGTEQVGELLGFGLDEMRQRLGSGSGNGGDDDTAAWLYALIRGDERSEVSTRTQIKSMLSAKSFRPTINTRDQAEKWLRIFVADIFSRLVEEGVLDGRRRPRTLTLHHRQGGQTWSRQAPIPGGKTLSEEVLFALAKTLLGQIIVEGHVWPCSNLSLSTGAFEDGPAGNRGIGGFLVKGDDARAMNQTAMNERQNPVDQAEPAAKRRRRGGGAEGPNIQAFFQRNPSTDGPDGASPGPEMTARTPGSATPAGDDEDDESLFLPSRDDNPQADVQNEGTHDQDEWRCPKCGRPIPIEDQFEHEDWHVAKDFEAQDRLQAQRDADAAARSRSQHQNHQPKVQTGGGGSTRGRGRGASLASRKVDRGQMRLTFGKG